MKKLILFKLVFFLFAQLSAQRSKTPWNNGEYHTKQHKIDASTPLDLKKIRNHFLPTNQNVKNNPIAKANRNTAPFETPNGINIAWVQYGRDIGIDPDNGSEWRPNLEKFGEVMDFVVANGGNVVRWWYHTNGSTNPVYDSNQMVTTSPQFFSEDVKSVLDLAKSKGLKVQICLWSFNMLKDEWGVDAVANKKLLTDETYTNAYISNALIPLVNDIGNHPALYAWEIFNEPEGMTNEYASRWPGFLQRVEMPFIQKFINKTAGAIRRAQPNVKITNGALGLSTNMEDAEKGFWNAYSDANLIDAGGDEDGYLDFYNVHYYKWQGYKGSPFHNAFDTNKIDKETVIGEYFPDDLLFNSDDLANDPGISSGDIPVIEAKDFGMKLIQNSWAGSLIWSWTDRTSDIKRYNMSVIMSDFAQNNSTPIANAGNDQTIMDSDGNGSENVVLNASESSDSDGSIVSYVWKENGNEIASGAETNVTLNLGSHSIELTVTDNTGDTSRDTVNIIIKEENTNTDNPSKIGLLWTSWDESHFANYQSYIDQLDSWGVEYISLNPTYFINTYEEGIVTTLNGTTKTPTIDTQKAIIKELIARQYYINYRPHLDPIKFAMPEGSERDNLNTIPGGQDWRGKFNLLDPINPTIKYKETIILPGLQMLAEAIREQGTPITPIRFDLGAELMDSTLNYPESWVTLQNEVKNLLQTTYSDIAEHIVLSHNYCHHIEYLLRLPNHAEYMDRIEPNQRLNPDVQFLDRDGVTYETLLRIGQYIAGLDEVSISQYMPMDIYAADTASTTPKNVENALDLHGENFIYEILINELGIAAEDLPALHIGEYGMGIRGLTAPNVWDADAWQNAGSGSLLLNDTEQKRQAAIGIDGIINYVGKNNTNYNSFLLWFGGAPYDLIGINEYSNWYNEAAANSLRNYWNTHSGAPIITTPNIDIGVQKNPIADAGADQSIVDLDANGTETITLDGSFSSDPDGIIATYIWTKDGNQIADGRQSDVDLPIGYHNITLTVTDDQGLSSTDQIAIDIKKEDVSIPVTNIYEAEKANLNGVNIVSDTSTSGEEYVFMQGNRGKITWDIKAPSKGTYQIGIKHKVPFGTKKQWLNVNTAYIGELTFTGSGDQWQTKTIEVNLKEGNNTLTLTANWGYMHIDYISLNTQIINREANNQNSIIVYPIPADNKLTINQIETGDLIYIYDLLGKTVLKTKATSISETLDISELKSGYYNIYVLGKDRKSFIKK
ncbi:CBM35 domain-containing protein [Aquimarina latercula]|uniref:CBM35 domain-containing protein n=1 Tax=Aquimarina latercula TaxID=987 RepID=UPI000423EF4A|nr:CBM35 domain-containing protein [Aquimarina latercula]